eukprot:TRINITY_DN8546_c0_g1_i1.p3 TRINITY_DN8546_c0_g1~~TRINITY_DN8546_c0_g1_i1.p3  ORF type:complete len:100 (-),score=12.89 TRINITY_DN8546_c0_g1_i1:223-522(-)
MCIRDSIDTREQLKEHLLKEKPTILINSSCKRAQTRSEVNSKSRERSFIRRSFGKSHERNEHNAKASLNKSCHQKNLNLNRTANFRSSLRPRTHELNDR